MREREWEQTRWLGALILNSQRSSKQPAIKPEDLVPLSIDKAHKESSINELKAYHKRMNEDERIQRFIEKKLRDGR
jgi:hypothetical protein